MLPLITPAQTINIGYPFRKQACLCFSHLHKKMVHYGIAIVSFYIWQQCLLIILMARYLLKPQSGFSRIIQVGIFIRQPHDNRHDKKEYEFYCSGSIN